MMYKLPESIRAGLQFSIASLIAFTFYNYFDLTFGFWSVITVAAVLQPTVKMTSTKALLRLFGTLAGVCISYVAVEIIKLYPQSLLLMFFMAMLISGYLIFANRKYTYLGIVCGITCIIIISTFDQYPALFFNVIVDRTIDVIVGILIAWFCSKLIFPISTSHITAKPSSVTRSPFLQAFVMAIATTLSLLPWFHYHYGGGFWAPIACLFIVEENLDKTNEKSFARFFAHVVVLFLASILSFTLDNPIGLGMSLGIGMFLFGYWMKKPLLKFEYSVANTMAIAYCIVLLTSPGSVNSLHTVFERFINTVLGIGIGMFVVYLMQRKDDSNATIRS